MSPVCTISRRSRSFRAWKRPPVACRRGALPQPHRLLTDFRRAYDADSLRPEDFDSYGASVRTLRSFIAS
jgi:hypothetical protein